MDTNGVCDQVKAADTAGATGRVSHQRRQTRARRSWGTRGKWCWLTGTTPDGKAGKPMAILDHTGNPGYPAYWHARGYGLFAVNPLGAHVFDPKAAPMNFSIERVRRRRFKYRVLVILSGTPTEGEMDQAGFNVRCAISLK